MDENTKDPRKVGPQGQIDPRFAAAHYGHDLYVGSRHGDGIVGVAVDPLFTCGRPIESLAELETGEIQQVRDLVVNLRATGGAYVPAYGSRPAHGGYPGGPEVLDELRHVAKATGTPLRKIVGDFNELAAHLQSTAGVTRDGLVKLLDEVRQCFTRDDDLPGDLLSRIDAAIADQSQPTRSNP